MPNLTPEQIAEIGAKCNDLTMERLCDLAYDDLLRAASFAFESVDALRSHIEVLEIAATTHRECDEASIKGWETISGILGTTCYEDTLTRIRKLVRIESDGWQTMETAPTEGYFLAWSPDHPHLCMPYEAKQFHRMRRDGTPRHLSSNHITHWRPLPAPPETKEK